MKKIIFLIIIIVLLIGAFYFLRDKKPQELFVQQKEGTIEVLDQKGNSILEYSIEEFNQWTKENWDVFEEVPQVGGRDVEPGNFGWFDETATISPDNEKLVFSVHDYAVATYTSFVGIIEIETKKVNLIKDPAPGDIDEFIWSPDSTHLAYTLGTGRAMGDYLQVDNVENLKKEFLLSQDEVKVIMPRFRDLKWEEDVFKFITDDGKEGIIQWSIERDGTDLKRVGKEDFSQEGNLMINSPGLELDEWYLSYEKEGMPALKVQLELSERTECEREDLCSQFLAKDEDLQGSRVKVLGELNEKLNLLKIEFLKETKDLKEIVISFLGSSYQLGPIDEDNLYRDDVFDSTTLILVSVANLYANDLSKEEMMEKINYYPEGEVSYENRLHFSLYRNQVVDYFQDITKEVGETVYQEKEVVLNKERLIDIDWEEQITFPYINKEDVQEVIANLPELVGVAFVKHGDEEIGLDIRYEGFLLERENFIHACSEEKKVVKEDFLEFLKDSDYDAVNFFEII